MRIGGAGMLTLVWLGIVVAHVWGVVEGLVVVMQRGRCLATQDFSFVLLRYCWRRR